MKTNKQTMAVIRLVAVVFLSLIHLTCQSDTETPRFAAAFYFGDSTIDTGNNNYIRHSALTANHKPYGIEFPGQVPTGRFSSGKLFPDFFSSYLGLKDIVPPYLDTTLSDEDLQTGVCFASAGSGFDDLSFIGQVITMQRQVQHFEMYKQRLEQILGKDKASAIVNNSLAIISAGTNDFVLNFYDAPTRRAQYNVSEYQDYLLNQLSKRIQEMYNLGLRTIVVDGLPPIGCIPIQRTVKFRSSSLKNRSCLVNENNDAQIYNQKLVKLLALLEISLPGIHCEYADVYNPLFDMVTNPSKYGFEVVDKGCCGTGVVETGFLCNRFSPVCKNPTKNLFWDSIHPSQTGYIYLSKALKEDLFPKLLRRSNT